MESYLSDIVGSHDEFSRDVFFPFSQCSRVELFMFVRYCEVHMYLTCNSHVEFCVNVPLSPEINY